MSRGLWDYATLLARLVWPRRGAGHAVRVWIKALGRCRAAKEGGGTDRRRRSRGNRARVSRHYCHSVTHSGHSVSPSVCAGPGRLAGDTLPLLQSVRLSLFQLFITCTSKFSLSFTAAYFICLCQGDFCHALSIAALHHRHPCQSSHTVQVLARGCAMPSFSLHPSPHPVFGSRTRVQLQRRAGKKKLWHQAATKASWMIDARMLTHHTWERTNILTWNITRFRFVEESGDACAQAAQDAPMFLFPFAAMQSYQFSLFHNLLAAEIARYRKVGLAKSDSLWDASALVLTFMCWCCTVLRLPGSQMVWCVFPFLSWPAHFLVKSGFLWAYNFSCLLVGFKEKKSKSSTITTVEIQNGHVCVCFFLSFLS